MSYPVYDTPLDIHCEFIWNIENFKMPSPSSFIFKFKSVYKNLFNYIKAQHDIMFSQ